MKSLLTLMLIVFSIIMLCAINVNAEVYFQSIVTNDYSLNTTTQKAYYTLDDVQEPISSWAYVIWGSPLNPLTTPLGFLLQDRNKPVDIQIFAQTQNLPYNLTYGNADWCNISLTLFKNEYNEKSEITNTSIIKESYYFTATPATLTIINKQLMLKDQLIVLATCHYTDTRSLYEDNVLVGQLTSFVPAFQCEHCAGQSVESLEDYVASEDLQMQKSTEIYNFFQNIITYNYTFWLILSWLFKIGALFVGIMLIFAGAFFVYYLFKKLKGSI